MVFLRTGLTVIAGLALTKALVKRTQDEPNAPNILPKLPDSTTTIEPLIPELPKSIEPIRPLIITDRPTEGAVERGKKGFGL